MKTKGAFTWVEEDIFPALTEKPQTTSHLMKEIGLKDHSAALRLLFGLQKKFLSLQMKEFTGGKNIIRIWWLKRSI